MELVMDEQVLQFAVELSWTRLFLDRIQLIHSPKGSGSGAGSTLEPAPVPVAGAAPHAKRPEGSSDHSVK